MKDTCDPHTPGEVSALASGRPTFPANLTAPSRGGIQRLSQQKRGYLPPLPPPSLKSPPSYGQPPYSHPLPLPPSHPYASLTPP
eukprot:1181931-Prorocentrum_minimum.AAC.9